MAADSKIEWTTHTFNPWRGCTKVSAGCANCYAETLSGRNPKTLGVWGPNGTRVVASESMWREPVRWNRDAAKAGTRPRVFCASLADVFEDWADLMSASDGAVMHVCSECGAWRTMEQMCHGPNAHMPLTMTDVRRRLFALIDATPSLDWLLLTKRPENIARMMPEDSFNACVTGDCPHDNRSNCRPFRPNLWLGVSVENQQAADERIPHLLKVPAAVRFLSCEPLLGPVDLRQIVLRRDGERGNELSKCLGDWVSPLTGAFTDSPRIHWVIVGGESGPGARPLHPDWVRSLRDQCQAAGVPFFFKQHGDWLAHSVVEDGPKKVRFDPPLGCGDMGSLHFLEDSKAVKPPKGATVNEIMIPGRVLLTRPGKKAAGRLLDGREWNEFLTVEAAR